MSAIDLDSTSSKEVRASTKAAERIVQRMTRQLKCSRANFVKAHRVIHAPIHKALGGIPEAICRTNAAAQDAAPILRLPNELKVHVLSYVDKLPDRLAFALSCKQAAQLIEAIPNPPKKTISKNDRFRFFHRLERWMNRRHRDYWKLCHGCLQYLPRTYRNGLADWSGKKIDLKSPKMTLKEALEAGPHCPDCAVRARIDLIKHKQEYRNLLKIMHK